MQLTLRKLKPVAGVDSQVKKIEYHFTGNPSNWSVEPAYFTNPDVVPNLGTLDPALQEVNFLFSNGSKDQHIMGDLRLRGIIYIRGLE